ncbi:MAG: hypothetical protein O7D91_20290 [Planctomycetota bacterium]|nr:hypothetical protein [Planctomycetota bacterium]
MNLSGAQCCSSIRRETRRFQANTVQLLALFVVEGTLLTVTAPPSSEGRRFVRWMVNGVLQDIGVRTIEVAVGEGTTLQALYRGQRRLRPDRPTESDAPLE